MLGSEQPLNTHGATSMDTAGADTNLSTQSKPGWAYTPALVLTAVFYTYQQTMASLECQLYTGWCLCL